MGAAVPMAAKSKAKRYQRAPEAQKIARPMAPVISAVPRFGCFRISAIGTSTAMAGGIRKKRLPILSQEARWNQEASARTRRIFISSEGWSWIGPISIQRCAPLPTCPCSITSTSRPRPKA